MKGIEEFEKKLKIYKKMQKKFLVKTKFHGQNYLMISLC